jgi:hypothetical protein
MQLSTGRIDFSADFIKSEAYFICEVQNMYDTGGIYIKSNIVSVEGTSDSEVTYIDNNIADLTNNVVHFNEGFSIQGDFGLKITGYGFAQNTHILRLSGSDEIINVYSKYDNSLNQYYLELEAKYKHNTYLITTPLPLSETEISFWIRRKNYLFELGVVE